MGDSVEASRVVRIPTNRREDERSREVVTPHIFVDGLEAKAASAINQAFYSVQQSLEYERFI
jgi:hypothetical protein